MDNPSHIVPVMVGDPVICKAVTDTLLPTTGSTSSPSTIPPCPRHRAPALYPSPVHSDADIAYLIGALSDLWAACPVGKGEYVRLAAE